MLYLLIRVQLGNRNHSRYFNRENLIKEMLAGFKLINLIKFKKKTKH